VTAPTNAVTAPTNAVTAPTNAVTAPTAPTAATSSTTLTNSGAKSVNSYSDLVDHNSAPLESSAPFVSKSSSLTNVQLLDLVGPLSNINAKLDKLLERNGLTASTAPTTIGGRRHNKTKRTKRTNRTKQRKSRRR
jgi:hypothetical protein